MKGRKHVNLFVRDSPIGAMCSSAIHEWAQTRYDSVTVVYCDDDSSVEQKIHELAKLIHLAERENANPCSERMIIVVDFFLSLSCVEEMQSIAGASFRIHDSWADSGDVLEGVLRRYLGFFKYNWPHGYRKLREAVNHGLFFSFDWSPLREFHETYGADELEKCLTAYLHDLDKTSSFNPYDMIDYYYDVFTERKTDASNQRERI